VSRRPKAVIDCRLAEQESGIAVRNREPDRARRRPACLVRPCYRFEFGNQRRQVAFYHVPDYVVVNVEVVMDYFVTDADYVAPGYFGVEETRDRRLFGDGVNGIGPRPSSVRPSGGRADTHRFVIVL